MPNWIYHSISNVAVFAIYPYTTSELSLHIFLLLLASNLIDIDHLLAKPIYDPRRNSIGFHVLHKKRLFPLYLVGCFLPNIAKFLFIGICLHLVLDWAEFKFIVNRKKESDITDRKQHLQKHLQH